MRKRNFFLIAMLLMGTVKEQSISSGAENGLLSLSGTQLLSVPSSMAVGVNYL